ncbi:hypothetical protein B0I35DRAFT_452305 [Stachybotrys elegans]|uniref:K Homology domain-containing protein n=1 Tax=Stachybotrys elegans TaxID=80388 RepID=A0A8K0WQ57_9HYPO|nr:hypothetical protein B0I35DRAFT_452305 [Stachybotrys elegans]
MASDPVADASSGELSAAQKLMQKHAEVPHTVTVEDAPDEDLPAKEASDASGSWAAPMSSKAAGKQKQTSNSGLDTQSHELFPELGPAKSKSANVAPIWGAKNTGKANGSANGTHASSNPASGASTPKGAVPAMSIPGRNIESVTIEPQYIMPRNQLKKPIPDIIKDLNRKSRATITMTQSSNGRLKFDATGPQEIAQQALKDLVQNIGLRFSIKVPIPYSARAHIIGKGGSTIKSLQEKTGAKIQLPKAEETQVADDDDDATIDVIVEGNTLSAASARNEILKIANERAANAQVKVRGIPTAFYPFLSGPSNSLAEELESSGVQVRVPSYQAYIPTAALVAPAPGQRPIFAPAGPDEEHIQLAGDRAAVQRARAEIERRAAELHKQLEMEQLSIQRGRHQFIIGDRGVPLEDFFADTGCAIMLPQDEEEDLVTVVGPANKVQAGLERAMDLAMGMQMSNIDLGRFHRNAPGGAATHAAHVTRYLRQRKEIARLEKLYNTHINTPCTQDGALPWELYSREGKNAIRAQSEITGIINGHPPSRIQPVSVDSFFHQHLRNDISPRVKKEFGVHLVIPDANEGDVPVLLVFEGPDSADGVYEVPRAKPAEADLAAFRKALAEAEKHILDLIQKQEALDTVSLDVPAKFHERLRRFIKKEQESRSNDQIPIRVTKIGTTVTLRGPKSAVASLAAKAQAFVEQEKEDDKERGFTLTFDFPQKFANHLIGKGGSNIKELRDRFDVEIQVQDGTVELKGPKAKAEAARSHIQSLGRTLADETTHILKIDPKYHRELIGAQGSQINRLQTRYKVLIFFPRSGKSAGDENADAASETGKPRRQQAPDEVMIRGPKKGADEARDEIYSLHKYLEEHSVTATIPVQQKQVGSLIGQGGAALDELRQATGARIDVPADRDTDIVEIIVKGTASQVANAKKVLEQKRAVFDDTIVQTIEVDKKHHKALIGASGSNLRDIVVGAGGSDDRRELARTVQFPKQDADGNGIKVEGRTEVVHKIIKRIQEIVAERESQITETVDVPIDQHRSLIGRGGEAKRQLESQFTVSIDVPRQGDGKTGVKIAGRPENVAKAKEHIAGLMKQQQGEALQIPRSLHHAVSNNGQFFRQLRSNHQVTVDHAGQPIPAKPDASARADGGALPLITDDADAAADAHSWKVVKATSGDDGEIPWVLKGTPENVAKAKETILKALEQAKKSDATGYLILPDPKTYRLVIGPGGSKVNAIRKQSGCKIQVPRDQAKDEAIEIIGSAEGVEIAKDLILAAVREGLSKSKDMAAPWEAVSAQEQLFVLVTGANSGIGLASCQRCIDEFLDTRSLESHLVLIPTTRSVAKSLDTIRTLRSHAEKAAQTTASLRSRGGEGYDWKDAARRVHILSPQLDLCDLRGVRRLAEALCSGTLSNPEGLEGEYLRDVRVPRLDSVIFNAAYGHWTGCNYPLAVWMILTTGLTENLTWPTFKISQPTSLLNDKPKYKYPKEPALGEVFCATVFGHYFLGHALLPLLSRASADETPGRIVWSSSLEAVRDVFNVDDIQCLKRDNPYESAKRLTDILALTSQLPSVRRTAAPYLRIDDAQLAAEKPVPPKVYLTHPGIVVSTLFPVPWFLMWAYDLALRLCRLLGSPWHTVDGYRGAKSAVWVTLQPQATLDDLNSERVKWGSAANRRLEDGVKMTEVEGWGWEGKVEDLKADTAEDIYRKSVGRKKTSPSTTKEDIVEFEQLGLECWDQMEDMRVEWEEIIKKSPEK